eukprot:14252354-Alexandrium_andersonii.AAC.1
MPPAFSKSFGGELLQGLSRLARPRRGQGLGQEGSLGQELGQGLGILEGAVRPQGQELEQALQPPDHAPPQVPQARRD